MKPEELNGKMVGTVDTVEPRSVIKEGVTVGGRYFVVFKAWPKFNQPAGAIITHPLERGKPNPNGTPNWTPCDYDKHCADHGGAQSVSFSIYRARGREGSPGTFWSMGEFIPQSVLESIKELESSERKVQFHLQTEQETGKRYLEVYIGGEPLLHGEDTARIMMRETPEGAQPQLVGLVDAGYNHTSIDLEDLVLIVAKHREAKPTSAPLQRPDPYYLKLTGMDEYETSTQD